MRAQHTTRTTLLLIFLYCVVSHHLLLFQVQWTRIGQGIENVVQISFIRTKNRYFGVEPVDAAESDALSSQDKSGLRFAVCHPTIHFGGSRNTLDSLEKFFVFVSYYRLLGFDHVFLWYMPEVANLSGFKRLQELPYVTLSEVDSSEAEKKYYGQEYAMNQCLSKSEYAADYDWALLIDADEYLWYNQSVSIKDYLIERGYHSNYTILSIGKYMYTMKHQLNLSATFRSQQNFFGLEPYPFTAGPYCYVRPGYSRCAGWMGRSKPLTSPKYHKRASTHGEGSQLHFDTSEMHLKEWVRFLHPFDHKEIVYHQHHHHDGDQGNNSSNSNSSLSFWIDRDEEVHTHSPMMGHKRNSRGQVNFFADAQLDSWMKFVATGCVGTPHHSAADPNWASTTPPAAWVKSRDEEIYKTIRIQVNQSGGQRKSVYRPAFRSNKVSVRVKKMRH